MKARQIKAHEQEIGYLRMIFAILLIADIILMGWILTSATETVARSVGILAMLALSSVVFFINRRIRRLIGQVRKL